MVLGPRLDQAHTVAKFFSNVLSAATEDFESTAATGALGTERCHDDVAALRHRVVEGLTIPGTILRIDKKVEDRPIVPDVPSLWEPLLQ